MARPRKAMPDSLTVRANFRLSPEESLTVRMNAAAAGLSVSEFCRRRVLSLAVTPPAAKADAALLAEINRIGVNVNQLSFAINADRQFKGDWEALRDELARVLDKVASRYDP